MRAIFYIKAGFSGGSTIRHMRLPVNKYTLKETPTSGIS
jgi:hypothetical protein